MLRGNAGPLTPGALWRLASVLLPAEQKWGAKEKEKKTNLLSHTFQVVDNPIREKTEENIYALCPVKRRSPYLERLSGQEHHEWTGVY